MISGCGYRGRTSTLLTVRDNLDLGVGFIYRGDTHRLMLAGGFERGGIEFRRS